MVALQAQAADLASGLTFYFLIWPSDATRRYVWRAGPDAVFWLCVALAVVVTALAILALRRLSRAMQASRTALPSPIP